MHSLDQITKLNREIFHDLVHEQRAKGNYVVRVMEGLHVYTFTAHADAVAAERYRQAAEMAHRSSGRTCEVLAPLSVAGPERAEDRDARQQRLPD